MCVHVCITYTNKYVISEYVISAGAAEIYALYNVMDIVDIYIYSNFVSMYRWTLKKMGHI